MWPVGVVVDPPVFDDPSCFVEVGEQVLIEALVAQATVEAFGVAGDPEVPEVPNIRCRFTIRPLKFVTLDRAILPLAVRNLDCPPSG